MLPDAEAVLSRVHRSNAHAEKPITSWLVTALPLVQMPSPYGKESACTLQIVGIS
jgi:hypothetical protein